MTRIWIRIGCCWSTYVELFLRRTARPKETPDTITCPLTFPHAKPSFACNLLGLVRASRPTQKGFFSSLRRKEVKVNLGKARVFSLPACENDFDR